MNVLVMIITMFAIGFGLATLGAYGLGRTARPVGRR